MYKVFIENRPIIFSHNITSEENSYSLQDEKIESIENDVLPLLNVLPENQMLYIICTDEKITFDRLFKPYDKISAAGGIVRRKNKFLFIKRNGFWDIPKGKLEIGETPQTGAIREIEEECSVFGIELRQSICETYHTYEYKGIPTIKKTHWFAFDYNGTKEVFGQLDEGITKVKWFSLKELEKVRKNTFRSIIEVIDCYFLNEV
jgi:8-oxo-dGTP pyrophosphatase MutT (NUDIX family)